MSFAHRRLGGLDSLERKLANAAADVLSGGIPDSLELSALREHDKRCAAALVAIVEVARDVGKGGQQ